jgi:acetyl esterase/lipase
MFRERSTLLTLVLMLPVLLLVACSGSGGGPTPVPPSPTADEAVSAPAVEVTKDVAYAKPVQPGGTDWVLDVYVPEGPGPHPVVIFAHGWEQHKEAQPELMEMLAQEGAVVFSPNYATYVDDMAVKDDGRGFREIVDTLGCAVRYARAEAVKYGGDSDHLTLVGHSMGAITGVWIALVGDGADDLWSDFADARGGPPAQVECLASTSSQRIDAVVGVAGPYALFARERYAQEDPELMALVNLSNHVGGGQDVRFRLIYGTQDNLSNEDSPKLYERLSDSGYEVEITSWDGGHGVPLELTAEHVIAVMGG